MTAPLRVAFYGNNLNMGEFIVQALHNRGVTARLVRLEDPVGQESREWWTNRPLPSELVHSVPMPTLRLGRWQRLASHPHIRELYNQMRSYDVIMMMEDGPALFSELTGIPKVFLSQGADLQLIPFSLSIHHRPALFLKKQVAIWRNVPRNFTSALRESYLQCKHLLREAGLQHRQRRGLRQCTALICSPHQQRLLRQLHLLTHPIHYSNFPMDPALLEEIDTHQQQQLTTRYAAFDLILLHPTRHLYLQHDGDEFLKDNDKLLHAFAEFSRTTDRKCRLLLINKGRPADLAHSHRLVEELRIADHVEWLPEMTNKTLRAYYTLDRVVVCDQFNPNLAILGNLGREATYYGKPLISAFAEWNQLCYGTDFPPHVLPAQTTEEICAALHQIAARPPAEWLRLQTAAHQWFNRHLHLNHIITQYLAILYQAAGRTT